jgi:hypothetical protein
VRRSVGQGLPWVVIAAALLVSVAPSEGSRVTAAPAIASISVSPSVVPSRSGRVVVRVAARHASTCVVSGLGVSPSPLSFPCGRGSTERMLRLGANGMREPVVRPVYVVAKDASGRSSRPAHAFVTVLASRASLPPMSRLPPSSPRHAVASRNWSGYVATGGPFLGVQGTFTVPNLRRASAPARTSEWVGIDGRDNGYLIQAGVEQDFDPSTGLVSHYAWWQILPGRPAQVEVPLIVLPGDEITVLIGRRGAGRQWSIVVTDDTTGQTFTMRRAYTGPAGSAEWVVEAPSTRGVQDTLGAYSPRVIFSSVGVAGKPATVARAVIREGGRVVSSPSAVRDDGFVVAYA